MNYLKGTAWAIFIMLGVFIGNNPVLLDYIPMWVIMSAAMAPFICLALMAARNNNPKEDI